VADFASLCGLNVGVAACLARRVGENSRDTHSISLLQQGGDSGTVSSIPARATQLLLCTCAVHMAMCAAVYSLLPVRPCSLCIIRPIIFASKVAAWLCGSEWR